MRKFIVSFIIIISALLLIVEIVNDFSILKTGYTIIFCKNGFVKDILIVNDFASASSSTSSTSNAYHGILASNNKKATVKIQKSIDPFLDGYKDKRILVYHSKYTSFNLFTSKPKSIFDVNLKFLLEPFLFLISIFLILYLLFKKNK